MPALNFTVFIDKILIGGKTQTIRMKRKNPIKPGDKLFLYTRMRDESCRKLGEAVCSKIIPITFKLIDLFEDKTEIALFIFHRRSSHSFIFKQSKKLALDDGFDSLKELNNFFISTYKMKPGDRLEFDIIKWTNFKRANMEGKDENNASISQKNKCYA